MIVECISDNWKEDGKPVRWKCPKKGELYEVMGDKLIYNTIFYSLYEFPIGWFISKNFKQVDIDISDAESKKLNELPIEVLI